MLIILFGAVTLEPVTGYLKLKDYLEGAIIEIISKNNKAKQPKLYKHKVANSLKSYRKRFEICTGRATKSDTTKYQKAFKSYLKAFLFLFKPN